MIYFEAWQDLTTDRPPPDSSFKPTMHFTIPYSSIRAWAHDMGHPLDTLKTIIYTADREYISWLRERSKLHSALAGTAQTPMMPSRPARQRRP